MSHQTVVTTQTAGRWLVFECCFKQIGLIFQSRMNVQALVCCSDQRPSKSEKPLRWSNWVLWVQTGSKRPPCLRQWDVDASWLCIAFNEVTIKERHWWGRCIHKWAKAEILHCAQFWMEESGATFSLLWTSDSIQLMLGSSNVKVTRCIFLAAHLNVNDSN